MNKHVLTFGRFYIVGRKMKTTLLVLLTVAIATRPASTTETVSRELSEHAHGEKDTSLDTDDANNENAGGNKVCGDDDRSEMVCLMCSQLDNRLGQGDCCVDPSTHLLCHYLVANAIDALSANENTPGEEIDTTSEPDEKKKRYGTVFAKWDWSKLTGKNRRKLKQEHGNTLGRWKWLNAKHGAEKRYGNLFGHWSVSTKKRSSIADKDDVNKRYGSTFSRWGWGDGSNQGKRYGGTFRYRDWSKDEEEPMRKRYGSTFNRWKWASKRDNVERLTDSLDRLRSSLAGNVDKKYGSTFSKWNWEKKRDDDLMTGGQTSPVKKYSSTFSKWNWDKRNAEPEEVMSDLHEGDLEKRYGGTFNMWHWGKRGETAAKDKRYGGTFNTWNWGKRSAEKRYGNTFNRWLWNDPVELYKRSYPALSQRYQQENNREGD